MKIPTLHYLGTFRPLHISFFHSNLSYPPIHRPSFPPVRLVHISTPLLPPLSFYLFPPSSWFSSTFSPQTYTHFFSIHTFTALQWHKIKQNTTKLNLTVANISARIIKSAPYTYIHIVTLILWKMWYIRWLWYIQQPGGVVWFFKLMSKMKLLVKSLRLSLVWYSVHNWDGWAGENPIAWVDACIRSSWYLHFIINITLINHLNEMNANFILWCPFELLLHKVALDD